MTWILALLLGTSTPPPQSYTCSTDYECEQECLARGEERCDDWFFIPEED